MFEMDLKSDTPRPRDAAGCLSFVASVVLAALILGALYLSCTAPATAATLRLSCTAPGTRNAGACDSAVVIPASASVVFVQLMWICWGCSSYGTLGYQQFRQAPGTPIALARTTFPGTYMVVCRVVGANGIHACKDTTIFAATSP